MIETDIQNLQNELNRLIDEGVNLSELYELSVKLDLLIVKYYNERSQSPTNKASKY